MIFRKINIQFDYWPCALVRPSRLDFRQRPARGHWGHPYVVYDSTVVFLGVNPNTTYFCPGYCLGRDDHLETSQDLWWTSYALLNGSPSLVYVHPILECLLDCFVNWCRKWIMFRNMNIFDSVWIWIFLNMFLWIFLWIFLRISEYFWIFLMNYLTIWIFLNISEYHLNFWLFQNIWIFLNIFRYIDKFYEYIWIFLNIWE